MLCIGHQHLLNGFESNRISTESLTPTEGNPILPLEKANQQMILIIIGCIIGGIVIGILILVLSYCFCYKNRMNDDDQTDFEYSEKEAQNEDEGIDFDSASTGNINFYSQDDF